MAGTVFHDPTFLAQLDVSFANLYFNAVAAGEKNIASAPAAWRPVFRERNSHGIARLQFALAGMNAHINRDLPEGLVQTFQRMGGAPMDADLRREDFESVNNILVRVEGEVKTEFSIGLIGHVDTLAGALDDVAAMWSVRAARAAAWTNSEVLWTLKVLPRLRDAFFNRLDSMTGFAARGMLIRLDRPKG